MKLVYALAVDGSAVTFGTARRGLGGAPARPVPSVEFYLYPTVGTVLIHSIKPELTE